jgi:hypothetical protein
VEEALGLQLAKGLASFENVFAIALVCVGTLKATPAKLKTLDRVTQIRVLTPNEASHGLPVRVRGVVTLRGVVTYYDPALPDLFVQDSTEESTSPTRSPRRFPARFSDNSPHFDRYLCIGTGDVPAP